MSYPLVSLPRRAQGIVVRFRHHDPFGVAKAEFDAHVAATRSALEATNRPDVACHFGDWLADTSTAGDGCAAARARLRLTIARATFAADKRKAGRSFVELRRARLRFRVAADAALRACPRPHALRSPAEQADFLESVEQAGRETDAALLAQTGFALRQRQTRVFDWSAESEDPRLQDAVEAGIVASAGPSRAHDRSRGEQDFVLTSRGRDVLRAVVDHVSARAA